MSFKKIVTIATVASTLILGGVVTSQAQTPPAEKGISQQGLGRNEAVNLAPTGGSDALNTLPIVAKGIKENGLRRNEAVNLAPTGGSDALPSVVNSPEINLSDRIKPMSPKVEGEQAQRKQLLTPLMLTFETLEDYEAFAPGKLTTNLILRNASSGQTKTIESVMLQENFRAAYRKAHRQAKAQKSYTMTIAIIIDDLMEPLMSAGNVELTGESRSDDSGVNLILTYSGLGSRSAQTSGATQPNNMQRTSGTPIKGIIVKGGRNPGGNIVAKLGDSQVMPQKSDEKLVSKAEVLILRSSKSNGSLKSQGF